ncbi:hypothetical protein M3221_24080 [Domibacillus indicus]|uniref:hypothetical protein n=1 Tax=Domibacillus indicus TaxID=1437523 RepID=UPI00203D0DE9|nr:hypothetical protein [Domibacillus indicus]MCM3791412.1 hypothetical protein [Domibacillus indicus]
MALTVDQKQAESPFNEMVITIVNESDNPLIDSRHFALEKYVEGIWYPSLNFWVNGRIQGQMVKKINLSLLSPLKLWKAAYLFQLPDVLAFYLHKKARPWPD